MGCANYIGRVGALAVTLGVGVALATPGIAFADETAPSPKSDSQEQSPSEPDPDRADNPSDEQVDEDETADEEESSDEEELSDEEAPSEDDEVIDDNPVDDDPVDDDPVDEVPADEDEPVDIDDEPADQDTDKPAVEDNESDKDDPQIHDLRDDDATIDTGNEAAEAGDDAEEPPVEVTDVDGSASFFAFSTADEIIASEKKAAPLTPQQRPTLVSVVTEVVAAVLQPLLGLGNGTPVGLPILSAVLTLVRNEFERILAPRKAVAPQQTVGLVGKPSAEAIDPTTQHVLVIAVDGTNLSRVIEDCDCENFDELMATSTTGPASIAGHTTISNPSWTAIMTGYWGERTGVINNVFTPRPFAKYPTVFNQVESINPEIDTYAVGNWDVINAIAGTGAVGADENYYVATGDDDPYWVKSDNAVAAATIAAIPQTGDAPNLIYSYYVGIDENGHNYGGDSPEYLAAVENMDTNLGAIIDAVEARELATGEQWTIIVVTDHGHQPQQGFGHGFQSPDETETFVIIDSPGFEDGGMNPDYEIVDTTPTIVALFGGIPDTRADGVTLQSLDGSTVVPDPADLEQVILDQIATNGYPTFITQVALGARTIFATIPYVIYTAGNDTIPSLPPILMVPAQLVFDALYVVTNVPAQIVAFATGVRGASIFPLVPPPMPVYPPPPSAVDTDSLIGALSA